MATAEEIRRQRHGRKRNRNRKLKPEAKRLIIILGVLMVGVAFMMAVSPLMLTTADSIHGATNGGEWKEANMLGIPQFDSANPHLHHLKTLTPEDKPAPVFED